MPPDQVWHLIRFNRIFINPQCCSAHVFLGMASHVLYYVSQKDLLATLEDGNFRIFFGDTWRCSHPK
jgi:hypothetical protein